MLQRDKCFMGDKLYELRILKLFCQIWVIDFELIDDDSRKKDNNRRGCAEREILVRVFINACEEWWDAPETTESKLEMEWEVLASDVWFGGEKIMEKCRKDSSGRTEPQKKNIKSYSETRVVIVLEVTTVCQILIWKIQ